MGHVKTWLTGIGLGYAVPNFEAAGIVTPRALAELNVAHFESLGVDNPDDRRKLFFLVQRIKMAAKEQQKNTSTATTTNQEEKKKKKNATANAAPAAPAAAPASITTPFSAASAQDNIFDVAGAGAGSGTTTQNQVELVLARTSSLLDADDDDDDDGSPLKVKTSSNSKGDTMPDESSREEQVKEEDVVEDEEKDHPVAAPSDEDIKKGDETERQVENLTISTKPKQVVVEEAEKEKVLPDIKEDDMIAAIVVEPCEKREGMADADVQVEEMTEETTMTIAAADEGQSINDNPQPDAPSLEAPAEDVVPRGGGGGASSSSCYEHGSTTPTMSTSSTISTHKSRRGPPSPEAAERSKNPNNNHNSSNMNTKNNKALARRKMSKLTTPVRRPVASSSISSVGGTSQSLPQAPTTSPSPLTMLKSSTVDTEIGSDTAKDGRAKARQDETEENYEEEKKQDISLVDYDEDETAEMVDKLLYNDDNQTQEPSSSSRRKSQRLIEKHGAGQTNETHRQAATAKSSSSSSRMQTTSKSKAPAAAGALITTPAMSNSRKTASTLRRASSDGISLHRQSGMPAPKSRRTTGAGASNAPKSIRTGKELSSIPSNSIAPMSPLNALTDQQVDASHKQQRGGRGGGGRRTTTAPRRTLSDSDESEGSSSGLGLNKNRRHSVSVERHHHHQYHQQQYRSTTTSDSSDSSRKRSSYRRRHSEMMVSTRQRAAGSHASTSSDDEIDSAVLEYHRGAAAGMSFESQIAALREENEQEHELFGKSDSIMSNGADSDEEDLMRIRVVVRKRPMSRSEVTNAGDIDVIQPLDYGDYGRILTYQPKTRVDLTKEIETIPFAFDNVFDDSASNVQIYERAVRNLLPSFFDGQWASIFAYGQTGSGKTFTMMGSNLTTNGATETENLGLYYLAALDIFQALKTEDFQEYSIGVSLFEIYGGKLYDLLNDRTLVKCLEDSKGKVCFPGLTEHDVGSPDALMGLIEKGACRRSTGTTSRNADSSRSHAVLQLHLRTIAGSGRRRKQVEHSRLTFIDLAGNERGADTYCADRATRMEGAEINTSLLALKEVIRALATGGSMTHVPFRGSKLTQVLKESFVGNNCRSIMIACISPNIGNCEQTLNTLRYANRVKERNPETGELSVVPDATSSRRASSAARNSFSSSFQLTDSLCGRGLSSIMNEQQQQSESEGGNATDILDELLASPSPAVTDSEGPGPIYLPNISSDDLMPLHPRHAIRQLLTEHEAAIPVLMNMLQDEMSLVGEAETNGCIGEYAAQLDGMHENQLELFSQLRNMIQAYRDSREQAPPAAANPEILSDDDGSFEDLRD
jgi:kinesin family member 2/24